MTHLDMPPPAVAEVSVEDDQISGRDGGIARRLQLSLGIVSFSFRKRRAPP